MHDTTHTGAIAWIEPRTAEPDDRAAVRDWAAQLQAGRLGHPQPTPAPGVVEQRKTLAAQFAGYARDRRRLDYLRTTGGLA